MCPCVEIPISLEANGLLLGIPPHGLFRPL